MLTDGMCGGPVVSKGDRVIGVLEGIVPFDHADELLRGTAVFVDSTTISRYVTPPPQPATLVLT